MHPNDLAFFEEYKLMDRACPHNYKQERGVTAYIEIMKDIQEYNPPSIEHWDDDFQKLLNCRRTRNRLAHDIVSSDTAISSPDDLAFLKSFHQRLNNHTDPLYKYGLTEPLESEDNLVLETAPSPQPAQTVSYTPSYGSSYTPPPKKTFGDIAINIISGSLGCAIALLAAWGLLKLLLWLLSLLFQ
ncbi:MAG: hypothetical protein E7645_06605 [Ruminococcaceae bacterium]|nr:hypothetical protein [Oscillospiraceae bacterium]